jgi:hypothetical protein
MRGSNEYEMQAHDADAGLHTSVSVKAGMRTVGVFFARQPYEEEGVLQPIQTGYPLAVNEQYDGHASVDSVAIDGPYRITGPGDTASRRRILLCTPRRAAEEESCAKQILSTIARRAYRRPVADADLATLMEFYQSGRKEGSFDAGIQFALERILIDPDFLFRAERDPAGSAAPAHRLADLELASRLSFFLWSSIPDDELLDAAARGRLKDPAVLAAQVRRMIADPRAKALIENFAGQWLMLRNIRDAAPDPDLFTDFDENLREAFRRETELFIDSQFREDRGVPELLTANYTFMNERLARHYGVPGVQGTRFRRVTMTDGQRGGLLGHGSLLTVTSYPNRTSPVVRGKWLLENILGSAPPPPPPDVPALPERGEDGRPKSVRERLEQHRQNPACAACHAQMDPLGFALEQFDAVGKYRTTDAGATIDPSGTLPDGSSFRGLDGLRTLLDGRREEFVSTVTEKLLAYALGRGLEHSDMPAVRKIVRDAAADGHRWSSIVLGVVNSVPFTMRGREIG